MTSGGPNMSANGSASSVTMVQGMGGMGMPGMVGMSPPAMPGMLGMPSPAMYMAPGGFGVSPMGMPGMPPMGAAAKPPFGMGGPGQPQMPPPAQTATSNTTTSSGATTHMGGNQGQVLALTHSSSHPPSLPPPLAPKDKRPPLPTIYEGGIIEPSLRTSRRRSRWDTATVFPIPGVPRFLPSGLDPDQVEAFLLRVRIEEISYAISTGQLGLNTGRERSPSPEPVYDKDGKRVNTREQRAKDRYIREKQRLLEQAIHTCPSFKPPSDFSKASLKKTRKVPIPEKDYPDYNFIGLIIGPRGNTQKRLEKESGAKISVRGKGSVKEGKIKKGVSQPDDDEPLHVLITGDTDEQVEKAYQLVMPLLTPMDESQNEWKKQQLRELAEINGTLRDRTWMQPLPEYDAHVSCVICGDASHPTSDCPFKGKGVVPPNKKQRMDSEYDSFMREIGEAPKPAEDKTYKEFLAAIGDGNPNAMPMGGPTGMPSHVGPPMFMPYGYPPVQSPFGMQPGGPQGMPPPMAPPMATGWPPMQMPPHGSFPPPGGPGMLQEAPPPWAATSNPPTGQVYNNVPPPWTGSSSN
ncbi:Zinc finger protein [Pelomyxa schiedti]|nr:Zinc finger protein [Pelomyxa schiedti]